MYFRIYEHRQTGRRIFYECKPMTNDIRSAIRFRRRMRLASQVIDFEVFGTLTYASEFLPHNSKHVKLFFNRLKTYYRKYDKNGKKIEYCWREDFGSKKHRPHYHFLISRRIDFDRAVDWWGRGFIYLKSLWSNKQINDYVSKYLAKGNSQREPEYYGVKRRFGFSKGIPATPKSEYFLKGIAATELLQEVVFDYNQNLEAERHQTLAKKFLGSIPLENQSLITDHV